MTYNFDKVTGSGDKLQRAFINNEIVFANCMNVPLRYVNVFIFNFNDIYRHFLVSYNPSAKLIFLRCKMKLNLMKNRKENQMIFQIICVKLDFLKYL